MRVCFLVFICFFFSINKGVSQAINCDDFLKYVGKNFNPPKAVKESCEWQYAVIKIQTDKNNKILAYNLLNNVSDDLKSSFKFLKDYQFPATTLINGRPIVFCVSIENKKMECAPLQKQHSPPEVLGLIYANLKPQMEFEPKTIFVFDLVVVSYSHDSIR